MQHTSIKVAPVRAVLDAALALAPLHQRALVAELAHLVNGKVATLATNSVLIKRSEAAMLARWSVETLARRERSDPRIPARISVGPGDNGPFAYRRDEWLAYLDQLERAAPAPVARGSSRSCETARRALAKRRARDAAEGASVVQGAAPSSAGENTPTDTPASAPQGSKKARGTAKTATAEAATGAA